MSPPLSLKGDEDSNLDEWKRGNESLQHMLALLFIDLCDPAELVVPTGGLQKLSGIIHNPGLTQLVRQQGCLVVGRMDQEGSTVVVRFCLDIVFVLEEEPDNTNVYLQLFLIWDGSMLGAM